MGKRKVIIELEFLLSAFLIESCLEHGSTSRISQAHWGNCNSREQIRNYIKHDSRLSCKTSELDDKLDRWGFDMARHKLKRTRAAF